MFINVKRKLQLYVYIINGIKAISINLLYIYTYIRYRILKDQSF